MYKIYEDDVRVVLLTGLFRPSANRKTGPMLQTWILVKDEDPVAAIKSGRDELICGQCPHRQGSCYVNVGQAPLSVYRAWQQHGAEWWDGRRLPAPVRLGAYGDPAFVPVSVWWDLCRKAPGWTGYTHQWRTCDQELRKFCMASVDSFEEMEEARRRGWRTFRVALPDEPRAKFEAHCPADHTDLQCLECLACDGTRRGRVSGVWIPVHGPRHKIKRFIEWRSASTAGASPAC